MYQVKKYGVFMIFGMIIIIGIVFLSRENEKELQVWDASGENDSLSKNSLDEEEESESLETSTDIAVDIKGAVLDPGVYTVEESARVFDVIELAGGFLENADEKQINLAQRIHDEMFVYVPIKGEVDTPQPLSVPSSAEGGVDASIRINQATIAELETLSGIGPGKAQAIIDYIEENGPLKNVEELLEVSGIGEKTLDKFKDQVIVP